MKYTIFGAAGFVGSHLLQRLRLSGEQVESAPRDDWSQLRDLGHAIYCIGLTADSRTRPIDTVHAHVSRLAELLNRGRFDSLLYLSSTRVYLGADRGREDASLRAEHDIFNLSKLTGEALCLAMANENIRVARLSNVFGPDWASPNFLPTVIVDVMERGSVLFRTASDSAKDYISVDDAVDALLAIVRHGQDRITNVASCRNVTNAEIAKRLTELTGCTAQFADGAPSVVFPVIDCERLRKVWPVRPQPLLDALPSLLDDYRTWRSRSR